MRRAAPALAALLAACTFDARVPPAAVLLCDDNSQCPQGYVCRLSISRCIVKGSEDVTAPRLLEPTLSPALASAGTHVLLTFSSDEAVFSDPGVKLRPAQGLEAAFSAEAQGPPFLFGYTVTGAENEGLAEVTVELIDVAGNSSGAVSAGVLRLDFTPPDVSSVRVVRPVVAPGAALEVQPGTVIGYRMQTSEPVRSTGLTLRSVVAPPAAPELVSTLETNADGLVDFAVVVPANQPAGDYVLALDDAIDLAGNHAVRDANGRVATVALSVLVDDVAPNVTGLTTLACAGGAATTFSRIAGFDCVRVVFSVAGSPAWVRVQLGPRLVSTCDLTACTATQAGAFDCACQTMIAATDPEGPTAVVVSASDVAGNVRTASTPLALDFSGPSLVPGTAAVLLQPDTDCTLTQLEALGSHGSAQVSFVLSEPGPLPAVASRPADLGVGAVTPSPGSNGYRVQLRTGAGVVTDGTHALDVTATDAVGNQATVTLPVTVAVDTTVPAAPSTVPAARVVLRRVPWGADETAGVKSLTVRGAAQANEGRGVLLAYSGAVGSVVEIGRSATLADGSFAAFSLRSADEAKVSVAFADLACNVSPQALVHDIEWVASLQGKVAGSAFENPNRFVTQSAHFEGRQAADAREKSAIDGLLADAGTVPLVPGAWDWRRKSVQAASATDRMPVAYDTERARAVLGTGGQGNFYGPDEVAEWDGTGWALIAPAFTTDGTPGQRISGAMAYDSARGRTVLFGGAVPFGFSDAVCEWDGARWYITAPTPRPGGRAGGAMAFDAARGQTVLFGGSGDPATWTYDGATWVARTPGSTPSPRSSHAMAYDSLRQRVVLFGGNDGALKNDTWEWDGATWQLMPVGAPPPARSGHGLSYDVRRGRTLLLGGDGAAGRLADLWEWNGTTWSPIAITSPSVSGHAQFYDTARDRLVVHGGVSSAPASGPGFVIGSRETWGFDGATWSRLSVPGSAPSPRGDVAMAFSPSRAGIVLFGGRNGTTPLADTWKLDETGWSQPPAGTLPGARYAHAMENDPVEDAVLLTGGLPSAGMPLGDTWKLGPTGQWASVAGSFTARSNHALGFDADAGVMVLHGGVPMGGGVISDTYTRAPNGSWVSMGNSGFSRASFGMTNDPLGGLIAFSGSTGNGSVRDTWRWRGAWASLGFFINGPGFRSGPQMAFDGSIRRAVMYGAGNDVWTWNGSAWAQSALADPSGDVQPVTRTGFGFAYDARRERLVAFGGNGPSGALGDTWELLTRPLAPSAVFDAALWSASIPLTAQLQQLDVRARAGGSGQDPAGQALDGARVLVWLDGAWVLPAGGTGGTSSATPAALAPLTWSTTSSGVLGALVYGRRELSVALSPRGTNGSGFASLAAHDVELELKYRLP